MDIHWIATAQNESGKSVIMRNTSNRKVDKRLTNCFFERYSPKGKSENSRVFAGDSDDEALCVILHRASLLRACIKQFAVQVHPLGKDLPPSEMM